MPGSAEALAFQFMETKSESVAGAVPAEFKDAEHARNLLELLEDIIKNGNARPAHVKQFERVRAYLGLDHEPEKPVMLMEDEESLRRCQGCIDGFHRTIMEPLRQERLAIPRQDIMQAARVSHLLGEARAAWKVTRDILQEHDTPAKEKEERIKGLLMDARLPVESFKFKYLKTV